MDSDQRYDARGVVDEMDRDAQADSPDLRTLPVSSSAAWPAGLVGRHPASSDAAGLHGQHAQCFELRQAVNDLLRAGRRRSSRDRAPAL